MSDEVKTVPVLPALAPEPHLEDPTVNLRMPQLAGVGVESPEPEPELDNELVRQLASSTGDLDGEITAITARPTLPPTTEQPTAVATPLAGAPATTAEDPLVRELRREAAATSSARRAAALLYELGRRLEAQPGGQEAAQRAYQESLQRSPGFTVAARALGRLAASRGDETERLGALQCELSSTAASEEMVAILCEMAALRARQGDLAGARGELLRAQKLDPNDPAVRDGLLENYRLGGAFAELESLLQRQARETEDPALRSALLCQVARLREGRLHDREGAEALYRSAHNTWPANLYALKALLRTARANRDYPSVARLCEALADASSGPTAAAALQEAARTHAERLRNSGLAITALERAAAASADDLGVLLDLADLYEREKRWEDLASILERATSLGGDPADGSVLAHRLAQVRLERLHDAEGAIAALRRAIALLPDNLPARRMLGRLYTRRERWEDLVSLLSEELEIFSDPHRRAATLFRMGEIVESRLQSPERALELYEQALALQPGFRPAMRAVSRLYTQLERFEDLVATYEKALAFTTDREERIQVLRRISEVWERRLKDPAAALSSYERLVAIEPSNPQAMRALHRLYAVGSRWSDLVNLLKNDADQTMDRWRRVALLVEAAEVEERQLADSDAALQTYLEVLEVAPSHQPALMAAGRILHRQARFADLLRLHERELEHTESPEHRIWLLMKIGRLQAEALSRPVEAARAFTEAMNLSAQIDGPEGAQFWAAADQLSRLYRRLGLAAEHLALLQKLPLPLSGKALSLQHRRMAEVLQQGQRPALAVEYLRRAVAASDDDAAFHQLARLYVSIGDRQSLALLYAGELQNLSEPRGKASVEHKLAYFWSLSDHELDRAVEALEHILELDPRNRVVLHQLELLLGRVESWDKLAAVLELIRYPSEDLDYRLACALEIAALKEDRLDDLPGAAHSAVEVLERHATHPEALDVLERQYRAVSNAEGLAQVLRRMAKASQNSLEQAAMLVSIGSTEANRGQLQAAAESFRLACEALPDYLPAARGWFRAAERLGDGAGMAAALQAEAWASADLERRAECLYLAAQTWQQRCNDQERAAGTYRAVLEVNPRHRRAIEALAALFTARRDWLALEDLLRHVAGHAPDGEQAKAALARLADVQRSRRGDLAAARETIGRALEIDPEDRGLLTTLAELCRAQNDYAALAEVDHRLVALTTDPVVLKALHFELGLIWEEKMEAPAKAIDEYRKVLELDPNDLGALTRLGALLVREEDWIPAARATELLIQRDDDRNRLKTYHLRLAHVYENGFRDIKGAMESCRRALALDPGDLEATERLSELLQRSRDLRGLNAHLASALTVHRARLERDPFRLDSYQAMLRVFQWQKSADRMFVVRSVMEVLGCSDPVNRARLAEVQLQAQRSPARALTVEEIQAVLLHPDLRGPLHQLLVLAEPVLRKVLPPLGSPAARAEKISGRSSPRLAALLARLAKVYGTPALNACQVEGGLEQLRIDDSGPPTLVIGNRTLEVLEDPQVLFAISGLVARVRLHQTLYTRLDPQLLGYLIAALLMVTCHNFVPPYPAKHVEELRGRLDKVLGKRLRRQLEPLSLELSDRSLDPARWLLAMEQTEDRLALSACGDVQAALRHLLATESSRRVSGAEAPVVLAALAGPRFKALLGFALGEEHLTLRERLGMAITG